MKKTALVFLGALCIAAGAAAGTFSAAGGAYADGMKSYEYTRSFDFTSAASFDELTAISAGIDPGDEAGGGESAADKGYDGENWVTYERSLGDLFTLDGGLKANVSAFVNNDVSANEIFVRVNDKKLTYYAAELVYTYDDDSRSGWVGFGVNYTNYTRKIRWGDSPNGIQVFVQGNGKGTYSSAKLNNSGYTENSPVEGWTASGRHTLTLVVAKSGVSFYADGKEAMTIGATLMEQKGLDLVASAPTFFFSNAAFVAEKLSYIALDENGDPAAEVKPESIEVTAPSEVGLFETVEIDAKILPETVIEKSVSFDLPAGVVASGNALTFYKAGEYEITVRTVEDPSVFKTFTVTAEQSSAYTRYALDEQGIADGFDHYVVTSGGAKDGREENFADYWNYEDDGTITFKEKYKPGVDSGYSLLYFKDLVSGRAVQTNCFEVLYAVKSTAGAPNGWHGVGAIMRERSTTPNQNGISAFIQEEVLKATVWGSGVGGVGGPFEVESTYAREKWNLVKVRCYGDGEYTYELYVNDMTTPRVRRTANGIPTGDLALFTTTTVTIGDVYFTRLDSEGVPFVTVYPERVDILNKTAKGTVGEKFNILAEVSPANATEKGVGFTSSDAIIAAVSNEGVVTYLNPGTVTITASAEGNPSLTDSMTIVVSEREVLPTSVRFDATPTDAKVGGKYTLFVTVLPDNATDYSVTFASSDESIATVDADGRMNFLSAGTVTITATCNADRNVKTSVTFDVKGNGESASSADESDAKETGGNQGGGCGSSVGGSMLLVFGLAAGAFIKKRRA